MTSHKRAIASLIILLLVVTVTVLATLRGQHQNQDNYPHLKFPPGTPAEKIKEFKERLNKRPLTHYDAPEPADPGERVKRNAKNKSYNDRHARGGNKLRWTELAIMHTDWGFGLNTTLPVEQSNAMVIGEVLKTRAFVSEDKTRVYSEFIIRVDEILKNDSNEPITLTEQISTERLGGRVRFPQGQISTYIVALQGAPEVGRKYVLFLGFNKHEAGSRSPLDMNRHILTGYELSEGRVIPLDTGSAQDDYFKIHEGKEAASFIAEIKRTIASSSQSPASN